MLIKRLSLGLLVVGMLSGCESGIDVEPLVDELYTADLTGAAEVPPVTTIAIGDADFLHDVSEEELEFGLAVDDVVDVTAAHIHLGGPDENGPVVAFLFETSVPLTVIAPTLISAGEITDSDVIAVEGFDGTLMSLLEEIRAGNAYVNVHTVQNPAGEIRGPIVEIF